jgi:hypothetical protein
MCGSKPGAENGDSRDVLSAINPTSDGDHGLERAEGDAVGGGVDPTTDRDNFHRGGKMNVLDRFVDPTGDRADGDFLRKANALPWLVLANDTSWSSRLVGGKASLFDDGVAKERRTVSGDGIASEGGTSSWSVGAIEGKKRSWRGGTSVKVADALPAGLGWQERAGRRIEVGGGRGTRLQGQARD